MHRKIPGAQMNAWVLCAVIGPILSVVGRNGWMTTLIVAVATGVLSFCILSCKRMKLPRWLCVLELIWLTIFLGGIGKTAGSCWPSSGVFPVIPIVLLLLAVLATSRGYVPAARTGATLIWVIVPVLGITAIAGVGDVTPSWIRMELEVPDGMLASLLLTPCLCAFLPHDTAGGVRWSAVMLGAIAVIGTMLIDGLMGGVAAAQASNSFYMFSKSIHLYGVAERFEALVACALTGSWFAVFALILSVAQHLSEEIFTSARKYSIWVVATVSGVLMCILPNGGEWIVTGALIFWGFLPSVTQGVVGAKNIEKK